MDAFEIITIDENECLKDAEEASRNIPARSRCLLCLESWLEPGKIKLLEHPVQALLRAVGITFESVLGCMGSGIGSLNRHGFCNECHALVKSSLDLLRAIEELQKRVKEKKLVIVSKATGDGEEMHDVDVMPEMEEYRVWNGLRRLISQSYSACTVASAKVKVNGFHRRTQVAAAEVDNYSDGGLTPDYDPEFQEDAFEDDCHADNGTFQNDNISTLLDDDVQCITPEEVTKPKSPERRRSLRIRGEPAPGDTKVKQIKPLRKKVRRVVRKYELRKRITNRIETYSQQTRTKYSPVRRQKPTGTRRKRGHGLTAKFKQTSVAARFNRIKLIPQRTFDCRTCSEKFVTELTLELHQQEVHNLYQGNLEYKCADCDFSIRADQCRISQGVFMLEGTFKVCTSFAELCERHCRCCENRIISVIRSAGPSSYEVPMAGFEAYICEICKKSFVERRKYEYHKTIHLIEKKRSVEPEPCGLCSEKFLNKLEFMEHVASTHQLEKGPGNKYRCMICHEIYAYMHEELSLVKIEMGDESEIQVVGVGQHYASLDDFRGRHLTTCGPVDPAAWIKCFECDKSYETRSTMLSHYVWKHEVEPQVCIQCEEEFPTYQNLVVHRRTHRNQEEPRYPCPRCPKSCPSPKNVMYHVLVWHVDKSVPCTCLACGEGMKTAEELNDHIVDNHPEWTLNRRLPPKVQCGFCTKEFFTRAEADYHSELEHSEVTDCPICKRTCITDLKLQNHIWKDHGLEVGTKSQWMCAYCYEIFPSVNAAVVPAVENSNEPQLVKEQTLKMFAKSHGIKCSKFVSETRQRKCFYCPQTFKTRDRLMEHEADEHTLEFNYICDQCGKSFASSGKLTAHRRLKHIPGKFKCPHSGCSKAYGSSEKLKIHITLHTGEKSFVCATCGKTFRLKNSLKVHEAIHDVNAPPVPCPMCGKLFKNKYQLHCHNFSVHKQGRKGRKKTKTATEATLDTNTTPVSTPLASYNPSDMIVFSNFQMHDVQNLFQNAE